MVISKTGNENKVGLPFSNEISIETRLTTFQKIQAIQSGKLEDVYNELQTTVTENQEWSYLK